MYPLPWYGILLISVPQTLLVIELGFGLFGLNLDLKKALLVAFIAGFITYFLRQSSVAFGLHTIILIITVAFLVTVIAHTDILHSLAASLLGFMLLGVIEGVCLPLFLKMTSKTVRDLALHPGLNILAFVPVLLIALALFILIRRNNFVIYDLEEGTDQI
ncbi:hypothetical protein [Thermosyntropha sp.]|uniref:hypothetical protein n=1 Tax=Thermosyntropha sp. TaxID=2740820 RepID=UPI0025D861A8|nr:hypothetical protein [Thermosyntropha sp.]MBO8158955.1 hypothetical protein [Thermosyntropha sp.]